ncbi:MAG: glycine--tRNA ligase [Candidatus Kerfeldbacteria bacterium]|nr:glycine--tRNA ligase [Candidatus Kerfeldbacteria bacterium]
MAEAQTLMDKIVNLTKRRGFIFPSAELYGGYGGFWDWGPLGLKLKNNIKNAWWRDFVLAWQDVVGLDGSIITNPKVWEASGHVANFVDSLVECLACHRRFKADDIDAVCPVCGGKLSPARTFNTMFTTNVGPVLETANEAYLRPETAQSIFVNYDNVRQTMRLKLPFGIAQIGKAFRNEITPGNFIFRSREFEQMELEYFVLPETSDEYFSELVDRCYNWFIQLGIHPDHLRKYPYPSGELAHYSRATTDIQFAFPIEKGWSELMGVANRTDYDLRQHGKAAKGDEQAFATPVGDDSSKKVVPYVIEPSMGVDRAALAFLLDAYEEIEGGRTTTTESVKETEIVLRLNKNLAPYQAAVLPLSKKPQLVKTAEEITRTLRQHWSTDYDETSSIGKRYRRQDEIGTPFCITVDFDTFEGGKRPAGTVTVRDRDSMAQENIAIPELVDYLRAKLA